MSWDTKPEKERKWSKKEIEETRKMWIRESVKHWWMVFKNMFTKFLESLIYLTLGVGILIINIKHDNQFASFIMVITCVGLFLFTVDYFINSIACYYKYLQFKKRLLEESD